MIKVSDNIIAKAMLAETGLCSLCLFASTLPEKYNKSLIEIHSIPKGKVRYYSDYHINQMIYGHCYDCKGFGHVDSL